MSRETKAERNHRMLKQLEDRGFSFDEAQQLFRIERALHRWSELECGTGDDRVTLSIERDEETGKPFLRRQWMGFNNQWQDVREPYPDKENAALKRLGKLMESHPDFVAYHQGDPRGCALYIVRKSDLPIQKSNGQFILDYPNVRPFETRAEAEREALNCFYTRGIAVAKE